MKLLIKKATIVDPISVLNGKIRDILIVNGVIAKIAASIADKADKIIEVKNLHLSIGWVDVFSDFADPGYEHRETIEDGAKAAAAGGFTDVFVMPNCQPATHAKPQVEYIKNKGAQTPVNMHPIGAVTKNIEGKELSEMYDMASAGAVAFGDGKNSIQNAGIVLKALQYLKAIDGTLIQMPDDKSFNPSGLINEGIISTQLGLPGKPAIAEELMIARDIELAKYTDSKIHFTGVSTKKGIQLIEAAKSEGVNVSCSVTPYHLFFCDEDLQDYNTNLKVNPVLRTKQDKLALQKALKAGQIDCIATHHIPQHWDAKTCEFEYAKNGMIGLETCFMVMMELGLSAEEFVQMQAYNNRSLFSMVLPTLEEGNKACLTLFVPSGRSVVEKSTLKSTSKNSAFLEQELTGSIVGIINEEKTYFN